LLTQKQQEFELTALNNDICSAKYFLIMPFCQEDGEL